MKKQVFKILFIGLTTLTFLSSCNKDNVSQEDVITNQQVIDLALRITDASTGESPIDSAVVEIVDGSTIRTATSDETGMVFFEDIAISDNTPVYVKKTDYIDVATEIYTIPEDYRQVQVTQTIKLYPSTGDNLVTISGRLTMESNVTNRVREAIPEGSIVRAYNYNIATRMAFTATTDALGNYEIKVPVDYKGNDYIELVYPEIYTNQRIAVEGNNYTISVIDRPTYFRLGDNAKENSIPALPSVYATIPAPTAATVGTDFSVASKVVPVLLSTYSEAILISGGSGYNDGDDQLITLSTGVNANAAQLQVDISDGSIVNIDGFINNSALYTSAPSINTNTLGGSGAEIDLQFECSYRVYITNNGSGYVDYPDLFIDYAYYTSNVLTENTFSFNFSSYTDLSGGKIVNDDFYDVDTIYSIVSAVAPEFTVVNTPTQPMFISFDVNDINDLGQIAGYSAEAYGYGYNTATPPVITLTAVAGYGSGAVLDVDLASDGSLSTIDYVNRGSGYVKNVNDFADKDVTWDNEENPSFSYSYYYDGFRTIYNVKPGSVFVRTAHYGTGNPDEN